MIAIELFCPFCGTIHYVAVFEEDYEAYQKGELVQFAFPYLNATEREQIISSVCSDCQETIFGEF